MSEPLISNTFTSVEAPSYRPTTTFAVTYGGGCYCRSCDVQDGEQDRHVVMIEVNYNGSFDRIWLCDDCLLRIHNAAVSLEPQTVGR